MEDLKPYRFYGFMKGLVFHLKDYCTAFFGAKRALTETSIKLGDTFTKGDEAFVVLCVYMCKGTYSGDHTGTYPKPHSAKALVVSVSNFQFEGTMLPKAIDLGELFSYPRGVCDNLMRDVGVGPTLLLTSIIRTCSLKFGMIFNF